MALLLGKALQALCGYDSCMYALRVELVNTARPNFPFKARLHDAVADNPVRRRGGVSSQIL